MKFHLFSDIHLEFCDIELPGGDTLLLAGDITVANFLRPERTDQSALLMMGRCKDFFFKECDKYKRVFYVMGNHEHYQGVWDDTTNVLREFLNGSNVTLLEKQEADLGDNTVLWGATLWTDMHNRNPIVEHVARHGMNDYHVIGRYTAPGKPFNAINRLTPADTIADHELAMKELTHFLFTNPDKKIVIMTHMAPCHKSSHPKYGLDNPMNFCYYTELSETVLNNKQIKIWVHGHTHDSHDYMIGDTRVLCNPRGYVHPQRPLFPENKTFDINNSFEV